MQFTHEVTLAVEAPWHEVWAEWTCAHHLPRLLSHVRAAAPCDQEDIAQFAILLEGRHVEFAAQRTMCEEKTLCWQSLGAMFLYVLSLRLDKLPTGGVALTLTVAYDPPGFLPDIAESLGLSRKFKHDLEADLHRYVQVLHLNRVSELALALAE